MIPPNRRVQATTFTRRERVRRGTVASEHLLQLFDTAESLSTSVSAFLAEGFAKSERMLVAATAVNWAAIRLALTGRGLDVDGATVRGQLIVLDAVAMLSRFMRRGEPNHTFFQQTVGTLVAQLAVEPGLRIYGEMVEVLACEGNYKGASQLEELWNQLSLEHSFTLLCGYSAAHFAGPDAGSSLGIICCQHSRSLCERQDVLSRFLLSKYQPSALDFPPAR
jgi:hypothetical protein